MTHIKIRLMAQSHSFFGIKTYFQEFNDFCFKAHDFKTQFTILSQYVCFNFNLTHRPFKIE